MRGPQFCDTAVYNNRRTGTYYLVFSIFINHNILISTHNNYNYNKIVYFFVLRIIVIFVRSIKIILKMPTVNIKRDLLFEALGTTYSNFF